MRKVLVTGGTVFVSRYIAEFFAAQGDEVYVLNRNTRPQPEGVTLIQGDRHALGDTLRGMYFDAVIDTAYTAEDVHGLLDALDGCRDYILISSSAVYPEYAPQPIGEETPLAANQFWGIYGTNKAAAEVALHKRLPGAYILRPPYLYGPYNNVYREAFVFDCALADRKFCLPGDGEMELQFFHVEDLCRFIQLMLTEHPDCRIYNAGNPETVSVRDWVSVCYEVAGKTPEFVPVHYETNQRNYFPFHNYAYRLNVAKQTALMPQTKPLREGLAEAFAWYIHNRGCVNRKPLIEFIDNHFA